VLTERKLKKVNADGASAKAEDFSESNYYPQNKRTHTNNQLTMKTLLIGLGITDNNGRLLNKKQVSDALKSVRDGQPTNGAKAIYDFVENAVKDGEVEVTEQELLVTD